jgi:hypothetical protein
MQQVRRRRVFYLSGFDPKGAAHYHALYRDQAALQQAAGGLKLEVGPRKRLESGDPGWSVNAPAAGGADPVETDYEFMRWDDVVRDNWPRNAWQLWADIVRTTVFYLHTGGLWAMFKLSWPPAVALVMPFLLLCALLLGMPALAFVASSYSSTRSGSPLVDVAVGLLTAALLVGLAWLIERRYAMYWMMRSYAFTARQASGLTPALESRLDELAVRLADRLAENADDEVLVVGHSSGAIMAAAVVARALRRLPAGTPRPVLSLLTLGQWLPLLSLLPQAQAFREELAELGRAERLDWVDFSAPPDGCCFALVDPLASCGLMRVADRPRLLSPRFAEMFDADTYKLLRRDKLELHFQYIKASARQVSYDYFAITAGPLTLAGRFGATPGVVGYARFRPFGAGRAG